MSNVKVTLKNILMEQTQNLYLQYKRDLLRSEANYWDSMLERFSWKHSDFSNLFSYMKDNRYKWVTIDKEISKRDKLKYTFKTKEAYLSHIEVNAKKYFDSKIDKLVDRLISKGVTTTNGIEILTNQIGVNFETIINIGDETWKAYTIYAEGEVNVPHYRYLVKKL